MLCPGGPRRCAAARLRVKGTPARESSETLRFVPTSPMTSLRRRKTARPILLSYRQLSWVDGTRVETTSQCHESKKSGACLDRAVQALDLLIKGIADLMQRGQLNLN